MGRAKLEIKYRENLRARRTTYMTRLKGLKKKASELSLLCGVDVFLASFSPELNTLEFWPEKDTTEFSRIRERYLRFSMQKSDNNCAGDHKARINISEQQLRCNPMPSPSFSLPSFQEEKAAIERKLKEVRDRLDFLQRQRQVEEEWLQAQFTDSTPSQQQQESHRHQQPSPFAQSLPPHRAADFISTSQQAFNPQQRQPSPFPATFSHELPSPFAQNLFPHSAYFDLPLQQDIHPQELPFPFAQCLPPQEQPFQLSESLPTCEQSSPFSHSLSPYHVADLNGEDLSTSLQPFDSPLWNHLDDLKWCDSLFLD